MARPRKKNWIYAVGRRKKASARVRLFKGKGENVVNGKGAQEYFKNKVNLDSLMRPFKVAEVLDKYHFSVKVKGGGLSGQLDASVHGIARALETANRDKFRSALKSAGLLTRDSRIRERRKVGTGGKARRKKQSPKR